MNELDIFKGSQNLRELALFAGIGGGILGGKLLGWRTICAVERDAFGAQILAERQNDGSLEPFPIWSDVCSFDGSRWRGRVDIISGGFPCQDISVAGKGAGIDGERSGMWSQMARIIGEVRPRFAFVENSPLLVGRGLVRVLGDLAKMGYDARWCDLGANSSGLPHRRSRFWLVAYDASIDRDSWDLLETWKRGNSQGQPRRLPRFSLDQERWEACQGDGRVSVFRNPADGLPSEVDELRGLGNAQAPIVAANAFNILTERSGVS